MKWEKFYGQDLQRESGEIMRAVISTGCNHPFTGGEANPQRRSQQLPKAQITAKLLSTLGMTGCRLIATVPEPALAKAWEVVTAIERGGLEARAAASEDAAQQAEQLKQLLVE